MKICLGFGPTEGMCQEKAGTRWSPYWCETCDKARRKQISEQLEKLALRFGGGPTPSREQPNEAG